MQVNVQMDPSVTEVITYITDLDAERITVVAPFPLNAMEALALLEDRRVQVRAAAPLPDIVGTEVGMRLMETSDQDHPVPLADRNGVTVFLGGPAMFPVTGLLACMMSGRWSLICRVGGRLRPCMIYRLILNYGKNEIIWRLRRMPESHPVIRFADWCRGIGFFRRLWRGVNVESNVTGRSPEIWGDDDEAVFREILTALQTEKPDVSDFVPRRILHVNAGLTAGGAERQICLTLVGLKRQRFSDVALLGEYKGATDDFAPYAGILEASGIPYEALVKARVPTTLRRLPKRLAAALSQLPPDFLADILSLAEEFQRQRPQVVQAWQDATSIRAGIAASIAGVPRIILCGRNLSPVSLPTYQPHFRAAYKTVLQLPGVVLTNNSRAGAASYAQWLDIDADTIPVIHNAIVTHCRHADLRLNWRKRLDIPFGAPVVGGIFRLVPQKQPLLWVHAAAKTSESFPDAHFVLVGEGTMRDEILRSAATLGLGERFHLLGNEPDVSDLYAIFDVFLLASHAEGLANVLLEAQSAGVPVVCTNAGGNSEAVLPGRTAIVVDSPDADTLALALTRVLRDEPWRHEVKLAGPRHSDENFSLNAMIEKTMMLCEIR